jgi:hypothetical protein
MKQWDVFISHASPDKTTVAEPLALALQQKGLRVWLDKWEIDLGSSISNSISEGLKLSRFGVVILSKSASTVRLEPSAPHLVYIMDDHIFTIDSLLPR